MELEQLLTRMRARIATAIPRAQQCERLWLLVSVALERTTVARFMGMSTAGVDEEIQKAQEHVAKGALSGSGAEELLGFRRSRSVFRKLIDQAARRRVEPSRRTGWRLLGAGPGPGWILALGSVSGVAIAATAVLTSVLSFQWPDTPRPPARSADPLASAPFAAGLPLQPRLVPGGETAVPEESPFVAAMVEQMDALGRVSRRFNSGGVLAAAFAPEYPPLDSMPGFRKLRALVEMVRTEKPSVTERVERDFAGAAHWSFEGTAGQVVRVAARSEFFAPVVSMRSPTGDAVAWDDGGFVRRGPWLDTTLPLDGRYRLRLSARGSTGPYQVAVNSVSVRPVEVDGPGEAGEGGDGGGAEYWSFEGTAGQVVRVTMRSEPGYYRTLRVFSPDGEEVAGHDGVFGLPFDGRYLVRVAARRSYHLAVRSVSVRPVEVDGGIEWNFIPNPDGSIVFSEEEVETEYWSFDGTTGQVVLVETMTLTGNDVVVTLLSPHGEEIVGEDDGVFALPFDGRYLVRVAAGGRLYSVAVSGVSVRPLRVDGGFGRGTTSSIQMGAWSFLRRRLKPSTGASRVRRDRLCW